MSQANPKLYILTGPVGSGKTSKLMLLLDEIRAGGILTPQSGSRRELYDIGSKEYSALETDSTSTDSEIISVGRFSFLASAMEKARAIIRRDREVYCGTLIIDELGKLEMRGEGLEPVISETISYFRRPDNRNNLLIIIRDYLLSEAQHRFDLRDAFILSPPELSADLLNG